MRHKLATPDTALTPLLWALVYAVAAAGVGWQASTSFCVPFPLNVLLLPLSVAERFFALLASW